MIKSTTEKVQPTQKQPEFKARVKKYTRPEGSYHKGKMPKGKSLTGRNRIMFCNEQRKVIIYGPWISNRVIYSPIQLGFIYNNLDHLFCSYPFVCKVNQKIMTLQFLNSKSSQARRLLDMLSTILGTVFGDVFRLPIGALKLTQAMNQKVKTYRAKRGQSVGRRVLYSLCKNGIALNIIRLFMTSNFRTMYLMQIFSFLNCFLGYYRNFKNDGNRVRSVIRKIYYDISYVYNANQSNLNATFLALTDDYVEKAYAANKWGGSRSGLPLALDVNSSPQVKKLVIKRKVLPSIADLCSSLENLSIPDNSLENVLKKGHNFDQPAKGSDY